MKENYFSKSFTLLKNNFMVIQPLIFGVFVVMLVSMPLFQRKSVDFAFIFTLSVSVLCLTAFLSGWYNCIKYTISLKDKSYNTIEEKNKEQLEIIKVFLPGVAENMIPVTVTAVIYFVFAYFTTVLFNFITQKVFVYGNFPKDFFTVVNSAKTQQEITLYLQNNLSEKQILYSLAVMGCGVAVYMLFNLLVLWLSPALIYSSKNPFVAIFQALKFTFTHFIDSSIIIAVMFTIYMGISILSIFAGNSFLSFIPMFLMLMYIMFYVLTVFLYYESETKNNSNIGSECNREI